MSKEQILEGSDNEFDLAFGQQSADMGLETSILNPESISAQLPPLAFVARAEYTRDGHDLIMTVSDGSGEKSIVIKNYFAGVTPPSLQTTDGAVISPQMVAAFMQNNGDEYYAHGILKQLLARSGTKHGNDTVAIIENIEGSALVIRNGKAIALKEHDLLIKGDVISTTDGAKLKIVFADGTHFQLGGEARISIDEFSFDEADATGLQVLSILHGAFSYASGLIAKDDPSSVTLRTPIGEIGIRGTKVVGNVDADNATASITILEGRAIYQNLAGRQYELDQGFDTLRISNGGDNVQEIAISPERAARDYDVFDSVESVNEFILQPEQAEQTEDRINEAVELPDVSYSDIQSALSIEIARELLAEQLDNLALIEDAADALSAGELGGEKDDINIVHVEGSDNRENDSDDSNLLAVNLDEQNGKIQIILSEDSREWLIDSGNRPITITFHKIDLSYDGAGNKLFLDGGISFDNDNVIVAKGYTPSSSENSIADDLFVVIEAGTDIYRVIVNDYFVGRVAQTYDSITDFGFSITAIGSASITSGIEATPITTT